MRSRTQRGWSLALGAFAAAWLAACGGGDPGAATSAPTESAAALKHNGPLMVAARGDDEPASPARGGKAENRLYIVQLADDPAIAYRGGVAGLAATKPAPGQKIDPDSAAVRNYVGYLNSRHDAVLAAVGAAGKKAYSYGYTFNGFAAELTPAQAARIATANGVIAVTKDEARAHDTASTPAFLGLGGGLWNQGVTGENVVIGIVDSGIWPEHPSFSDRTGVSGGGKSGKLGYARLPRWKGLCQPGEQFSAAHCNQKLIGARYYNAGWGGNAGIDAQLPWEFNSPRDYNGHGTHTASTAGGNANVPATGDAAVFGTVSGIAPRARIAAYKVCWDTGETGSCFNSDSVAAIDQAVADGVDVINFSIGGSRTSFLDPVQVAFLFAADAGVFVAASAGNSGPTTSTVAHPGPWLTTVAAGTHNRNGTGSVTLGNGMTYTGASLANALGVRPLVDSAAAVAAEKPAADAELCVPGALNPAVVSGKIVLCKRGVIALVDKTRAVAEAGGVGAVIYNDPAGAANTLALMHSVPTVHVVAAAGLQIKDYIASAGSAATASIAQATLVYDQPAPLTADFSSRGPLLAGGGDLLKPDVIAPGQDIVAGVAPPGNGGQLFGVYSGTSMSSPHVAGVAALLKQLRPGWSPMAIKSALMTTAYDVLDGGTPAPNTNPVLIFRQGAGHIDPTKVANPGLVFDHGFNDWLAFLCGTGQLNASYCPSIRIDPSDLNVASIAIGDLAGPQTVTRKVRNVGSSSATYALSHTGMTGFDVTISPAELTVAPGQTKSFQVTFNRTDAALNAYTGGQLRLTAGDTVVRVPMVVRPVALAAPAQVSGNGGPISYGVKFGYSGAFTATPRGLIPAQVNAGSVADDPTDGSCSLEDKPYFVKVPVTIPAGATYARFSLFDADVTPGTDLDLCVFRNDTGALIGISAGGTSNEEVNFVNPPERSLTVVIHGWGVAGSSPFKLHHWVLGSADAGNMTVSAPAAAVQGETGTIELGFGGLAAGTKYLGSVAYGGAAGMPNPTIVRVDAP